MNLLVLNTTTKSIEIKLAGSITTNQLDVTAHYADATTSGFTEASSDTATNNTTAVTVVSAPAASTQRIVREITVHNKDTASATVTIQLNNNSTIRIIKTVTLAAGEEWALSDSASSSSSSGTGGTGDALTTLVNADVSVTTTTTLTSTAFTKMHIVTGASDYTITLPAVSGNNGKWIGLKFEQNSGVLVTVDGNASEKIGLDLTRSYIPGEAIKLYCDGTMWKSFESLIYPYVKAKRGSAYTLTDSTWTRFNYDSEVSDASGIYDNATNYRVTCPRPGIWQFTHSLRIDTTTVVLMAVGLYRNASSGTPQYIKYMFSSSGIGIDFFTTTYNAIKGDYFSAAGFCDSGGTINVDTGDYTFFEARWLGHS